ncbi:MAG: hypothetical protein K2I96_04155 [Lachnospiraceae bacterium]|nr:hypothetical protein [Lachnospiraceae bacterium]
MTKKELEQLMDLKKEINELEQSILKIEQMDIEAVPVKVDASSKNFPYIQGKMAVKSYNPVLANKRANLLYSKRVLLEERKSKAAAEETRLLHYINSIQESKVRRIMQFRYIDGYSWETIGSIMHFDRRTGERIVSRYLRQDEKSS